MPNLLLSLRLLGYVKLVKPLRRRCRDVSGCTCNEGLRRAAVVGGRGWSLVDRAVVLSVGRVIFGLSPFPKCIIIMCLSKHKYLFYAM